MSNFIEIKGTIIAQDEIAWIEYLTAAEIKAANGGIDFSPPVEPEGRTYVTLKNHSAPHWIRGDVRDELRTLLYPRWCERR